ncbi:MAG: hypothetical protein ACO3K7_05090 [Candidatus Marinamargulisbacteria bacterium]
MHLHLYPNANGRLAQIVLNSALISRGLTPMPFLNSNSLYINIEKGSYGAYLNGKAYYKIVSEKETVGSEIPKMSKELLNEIQNKALTLLKKEDLTPQEKEVIEKEIIFDIKLAER